MPKSDSEPRSDVPAQGSPSPSSGPAPSPKEVAAQEAALAAEVSAEHAVKAAEQAEAADLQAARAAAGGPVCPNCHGELIKHGDENPFKAGASHCNKCGICFAPGLKHPR